MDTAQELKPQRNEPERDVRGVRFGIFELDFQARELRRRGVRVKLQQKPFQILELLVERSGELVTRRALREKLWPDTFVGFDRSLNTAVNSLRRALGDSSANSRFIETRSREGYRFIAPVERVLRTPEEQAGQEAFHSIAVLPFENATGDSELNYLCDGITENVINSLSRLPKIRVMARSTVFRYQGQEIDPQTVGHDLNVSVLLTGKVRKRRDAVQASVELVDTLRGWRLWGEEYNREWQAVFEVEAEIAKEISDQLRLRLTDAERNEVRRRYTANSDAYRSYLRGRYQLNKMTEDGLNRALECFEEASRADSGFALPYAGMAEAYSLFAYFGIRRAREVMPLSEAAAERALAIDSRLPEAHACLAGVLKSYLWDWRKASDEYQQALSLNPNYATGRRWYADYLSALGRFAESEREMEQALELDPFSLVIHTEIAWNAYMARDNRRAADQALKTLEMEPRFAPALHALGLAYEQEGKHKESVESFEKAVEYAARNPISVASLARALAVAGRQAQARKLLTGLMKGEKYVPPYIYAILHLALGEADRALDALETAYREHDVWLVWIRCDPRLDAVRSEARFKNLLRGMNLERAAAAHE